MGNAATLAAIALGGAIGALCRFGLARLVAMASPSFPYGTLAANIIGCFLIGLLTVWFEQRSLPYLRSGILIGFLGALTTFSTFSYESLMLMERGQTLAAFLNVVGTVIVCLAAAFGGLALGKAMFVAG
ncbi:MAG: fluoride efflux transporter CrcB [Phycisphaera sp.]|nr:fluoride efflux transporter CrcB [Phycisphaera sp.]